jgi:hypothetical protein
MTGRPDHSTHEEHLPFWVRIARLYNPKYQLAKIREDLKGAMTALKHWHFDPSMSFEVLASSFRGKMFAAFFVSGMLVWPGIAISWWVQAQTENTFLGIAAMLLFTQIACTVGFQSLWYLSNRELYRTQYSHFQERFMALQHDILPAQWKGFKMVIPVISLTYPIVATLTHWIATVVPGAIKALPAGGLSFLVELLLISTPFMRAMGDLFESHTKKLAAKYVRATPDPA